MLVWVGVDRPLGVGVLLRDLAGISEGELVGVFAAGGGDTVGEFCVGDVVTDCVDRFTGSVFIISSSPGGGLVEPVPQDTRISKMNSRTIPRISPAA